MFPQKPLEVDCKTEQFLIDFVQNLRFNTKNQHIHSRVSRILNFKYSVLLFKAATRAE